MEGHYHNFLSVFGIRVPPAIRRGRAESLPFSLYTNCAVCGCEGSKGASAHPADSDQDRRARKGGRRGERDKRGGEGLPGAAAGVPIGTLSDDGRAGQRAFEVLESCKLHGGVHSSVSAEEGWAGED